jgi:hypothetical protein
MVPHRFYVQVRLRRAYWLLSNALVQLQAHLTMHAQRAIQKCLSAATFVRQLARRDLPAALSEETFGRSSLIDLGSRVGPPEVLAEPNGWPQSHVSTVRAETGVGPEFAR